MSEKQQCTAEGGCIRRAILRLGDKTTAGGRVLEGIASQTHRGIPKTFIGAKVWCPACESTGVIGWKGPHHTAIMKGKQQALDGDICLCKCDPPPVCRASQDSAWHVFEPHELASAEHAVHSARAVNSFRGPYDEQFRLVDDNNRPRANVRYRIMVDGQQVISGTTNANGQTERVATQQASGLRLQLEK